MDIEPLSARLDIDVYACSVYTVSPLPRLGETEWPRWLPTWWHSHGEADIQEKWPLFLVDDLQTIGQGRIETGFLLHALTFHAKSRCNLYGIDTVKDHAVIFVRLLHGTIR
jgi:hypothetical protein